jgi:uncharacterized protein YjbJ (UPF0337 family)
MRKEARMGEWQDKAEGKLKETEGKLTDDEVREKQGQAQQKVGAAKGAFEDVTDKVRDDE